MVWYCNRESVKAALFEMETARSNAQVDAAIEQGARDVDGLLTYSHIAPTLATMYFDYPSRTSRPPSWRLWLNEHPLLTAQQVTTNNGATLLAPGTYYPEPANSPPYNRIEINLGGTASWSSASTHQRAIAVQGVWGLSNTRRSVGTLAGALGATESATASLTWTTARFGVGDVLFVDSEAMIIREKTMVDTGQNLAADLAADDAATTVSVPDGTAYAVEEVLLIGGERLYIVDIAGNTLVVKRAWDGSQLAGHTTGADIFALTGIELDRAQLGTTIAAHSSSAAVYQWVPEGDISALNLGYAISTLLNQRSGYARALSAASDTAVEVSGRSLAKLEADVDQHWGRSGARHRAIV